MACEPALVEYRPEQLGQVPMALFPTSGRQGREVTLIAMPAVSSAAINDINDYDLGPGILAPTFDTDGGTGCKLEGVQQLLELLGETYQDRYPVCFHARIEADAPAGERVVTVEFTSDGEPLLGRATFTVFAAGVATEQVTEQEAP